MVRKLFLFFTIGLILGASSSNAQDQPIYKVYLTNKVENDQPLMEDQAKTTFDCTDRIYLVVEALGLTQKKTRFNSQMVKPGRGATRKDRLCF